ncbi:hypothetical protein CEXT_328121 [Caerostris extrusa]|uniref:Uncharacterized protein n=1 Tax=Caerostris extrusa TaxID=172846 RepID=A0AAV4Q5W8_CAEEX|nr:hypothetical protein CEXT_328121 [Caerostris extrusa]
MHSAATNRNPTIAEFIVNRLIATETIEFFSRGLIPADFTYAILFSMKLFLHSKQSDVYLYPLAVHSRVTTGSNFRSYLSPAVGNISVHRAAKSITAKEEATSSVINYSRVETIGCCFGHICLLFFSLQPRPPINPQGKRVQGPKRFSRSDLLRAFWDNDCCCRSLCSLRAPSLSWYRI